MNDEIIKFIDGWTNRSEKIDEILIQKSPLLSLYFEHCDRNNYTLFKFLRDLVNNAQYEQIN